MYAIIRIVEIHPCRPQIQTHYLLDGGSITNLAMYSTVIYTNICTSIVYIHSTRHELGLDHNSIASLKLYIKVIDLSYSVVPAIMCFLGMKVNRQHKQDSKKNLTLLNSVNNKDYTDHSPS